MARYWVENSASRKSRCLVGATRTTRRLSSPSAARVRHRIVSLENPLEPGAWTSKTSGPDPSADLVASQRERMEATWSGSRWLMSGTERHSTDDAARPARRPVGAVRRATAVRIASPGRADSVARRADRDRPVRVHRLAARARRVHPLLGGPRGRGRPGPGGAPVRSGPAGRRRRARRGRPGAPCGRWRGPRPTRAGTRASPACARTPPERAGWSPTAVSSPTSSHAAS